MVDQLNDLADSRLLHGCIYCGGLEDTRDHVPSRVFLDAPFPENLPVVPACRRCNSSFSRDEEYVVCLIESVLVGTTDPDRIERPRVAEILRRSPALRSRIEAAKQQSSEKTTFAIEEARARNVLLKLARGHAAFELSAARRDGPQSFGWCPIPTLSSEQIDSFDAAHVVQTFGEIGSRSAQRMRVAQVALRSLETGELKTEGLLIIDWVDVQEGRYRYLAVDDHGEIRVKIIIREYLACEVTWIHE
jgi:hypothetical protein